MNQSEKQKLKLVARMFADNPKDAHDVLIGDSPAKIFIDPRTSDCIEPAGNQNISTGPENLEEEQ